MSNENNETQRLNDTIKPVNSIARINGSNGAWNVDGNHGTLNSIGESKSKSLASVLYRQASFEAPNNDKIVPRRCVFIVQIIGIILTCIVLSGLDIVGLIISYFPTLMDDEWDSIKECRDIHSGVTTFLIWFRVACWSMIILTISSVIVYTYGALLTSIIVHKIMTLTNSKYLKCFLRKLNKFFLYVTLILLPLYMIIWICFGFIHYGSWNNDCYKTGMGIFIIVWLIIRLIHVFIIAIYDIKCLCNNIMNDETEDRMEICVGVCCLLK